MAAYCLALGDVNYTIREGCLTFGLCWMDAWADVGLIRHIGRRVHGEIRPGWSDKIAAKR